MFHLFHLITFDAAKLEEAFASGAKALILCNPSNPCGKVFTMEEMQTIAELAKKYDAYVVTDEVYEHIIYAPNKHVYMQALDGMRERTIVCNSLSENIFYNRLETGLCYSESADYRQSKESPRFPYSWGSSTTYGGGCYGLKV